MSEQLPDRWPDQVVRKQERPLQRVLGRLTSPKMLRDHDQLAKAVRDKVVVVTGASSGLGKSIAEHCGRAGAIVVICARSADLLDEVAGSIRAQGGRAHSYRVDLSVDEDVRDFAERILRDHGQVDILIHNAGKSLNRRIDYSYRRPKDLLATTGVNYLGPARLTMLLLPYMRARGQGHIVNIATAGLLLYPAPGWSFYLASKAAFDWWLRSVAPEARADGVYTTHYYLGSVRTKMSAPDKVLHLLPSQSADDAAWGVARAIVRRPRSVAQGTLYVVAAGAALLRTPMDLFFERMVARRRPSGNAFSRSRAAAQEEFVVGDPQEFLDSSVRK